MKSARWLGWLGLLPLVGWWLTGLFDLDEGFYGAVISEMNRRGEWITPYYNGAPWFEKPIFTYWAGKPFIAIFGTQWGARLPSILATALTLGVLFWFVRRRLNLTVFNWTGLILGSSLLYVALGRMLMTDPWLNLALVTAFLTFYESIVGDVRWRWASAAALGVGVLAKGPVADILFFTVLGVVAWRLPELRSKLRGGWLVGLLIHLAVVATWYMPAYLVNGQTFVQKFLIEQNLQRFLGGDAAHTWKNPLSYLTYVGVILLGMLPWSGWIYKAWPRKQADPLRVFLAAWAGVVFVFFTVSGAKLPHYVLPCFVPLAILVAIEFEARKADLRWGLLGVGIMTIVANAGFIAWYGESRQNEAHELIRIARVRGGEVTLFQLSRRQKELGTGSVKIQETSLPSLIMELGKPAKEAEDAAQVSKGLVFTRTNRTPGPTWRVVEKREAYVLYEVP